MAWESFTTVYLVLVIASLNCNYAFANIFTLKEAIGYNEDALLNFTGLATKYGYKSEQHVVITEDGYILSLFRISNKTCRGGRKPLPLVLMHGLLDSSDSFIIAGPEAGLAYRLADACHDVWCPNHRGNRYSRNHLTLNHEEDSEYWNFSYDEHGTRDLPAIVDYVLNNTAATSINYLGHSQGTTDFFILNSVRPDYNRKFNLAICFAPVAWLYHLFSPLLRLLAKYEREIGTALRAVGVYKLLGRNQPIPDKLLELFCQYIPEVLCGSTFFLVTGVNPSNIRRDILRGIVGHYPSASSVKNLLHFAQAVNVNSFRRFDYESEGSNMAVYGTPFPPEYNVSNVNVRVALLRGDGDFLVSMQDVETLYSHLPNVIDYYVMPEKDWSHFDFVWGKRIPDQLLPKVFEYLDLYAA